MSVPSLGRVLRPSALRRGLSAVSGFYHTHVSYYRSMIASMPLPCNISYPSAHTNTQIHPRVQYLSTTLPLSQAPPLKDWRLGRLNHIAIAVPDLERATQLYRDTLGASVSETVVRGATPCSSLTNHTPSTTCETIHVADTLYWCQARLFMLGIYSLLLNLVCQVLY